MRLATSLVLSLGLVSGACFPNNARHRTVAKIAEGGVTIAGIVLLSGVGSPADCMSELPGVPNRDCESRSSLLGNIGLGLILTGLVGFIVTVSTAPDDTTTTPSSMPPLGPVQPTPTTTPPAPSLPPSASPPAT